MMLHVFRPTPPLEWSLVSLIGPDAPDFLHRLSTANVRALEVGQGAPGCFLTAQGRIRSYFTLWCFGPAEYAFELDAGATGRWRKELLAAIDQYTFAEKFAVTQVTGLENRWLIGEAPPDLGSLSGIQPGRTEAIDEEIRVSRHPDSELGRPWLSVWARPARLAQWLERAFPEARSMMFEEIERLRILALRPRVDAEIGESTLPLEVGLSDAIAGGKGCYPGQEVIERIISLGAPPRRLALIEGAGEPPAPGAKVLNLAEPAAEVGEITSVSRLAPERGGARFAALAMIRKIHAREGLEVKLPSGASASIRRVAPYA